MSYLVVGFICFMIGGLMATIVFAAISLQEDDEYHIEDFEEDEEYDKVEDSEEDNAE